MFSVHIYCKCLVYMFVAVMGRSRVSPEDTHSQETYMFNFKGIVGVTSREFHFIKVSCLIHTGTLDTYF